MSIIVVEGSNGTGKTTVARIMAKMLFDMGIIKENKFIEVERKDLIGKYVGHTAIKTNEVITKAINGVLFIDEAYSLNGASDNDFGSESIATLIKAMEDYKDKMVVIFAGYKKEMMDFIDSNPGIRSRIGYTFEFSNYTTEELTEIVKRSARVLDLKINDDAATIIAKRSRKTPRIANRLLKRVSDFALVNGIDIIDREISNSSLNRLHVDEYGLDNTDIEYLTSLINRFNGGPVGIESIAASIGEEQTTIEDVIEPFLLQEGFIKRTTRGRQVTEKTYDYLKIEKQSLI